MTAATGLGASFASAGQALLPTTQFSSSLANLVPSMSMPTNNLASSANLAGGVANTAVPFTATGAGGQNLSWLEQLGLSKDGSLNWDNLANLGKGAAGVGGLGMSVANYYQQKDQNSDMMRRYDESTARQQKLDAVNAVGQQRYMNYKGWGTDGQKDKYNQLVNDLTNTSVA